MIREKFSRLSILLGLLIIAGFTYIISADQKPEIIFAAETTYYIPGKNGLCDWVGYIETDVTRERGSFSRVFIGIPKAEVRGSIVGVLEVHGDIAVLSYNLTSQQKALPVVMMGNLGGKDTPIKSIRFRWLKSSVLTIPFYSSRESCIKGMEELK